jgi:hypothetical protein
MSTLQRRFDAAIPLIHRWISEGARCIGRNLSRYVSHEIHGRMMGKPEVRIFAGSWREQANAYSIGACDQRRDLERIVNGVTQILLTAQISLRRLDRDMAE